jgi:hypothetical protein
LVLDNLPTTAEERLLRSRKLAFRGNSGIWGVQARARVNTAILAPSRDAADFVDQAMIGGWVDFRRLRADTRWALFRRRRTHSQQPHALGEPIDPAEPRDGPMLIREFCSDTLPPIEVVPDSGGDLVHELGPSPLGTRAPLPVFSVPSSARSARAMPMRPTTRPTLARWFPRRWRRFSSI